MSGHSKWASIRHKKGAVDAKRGKVFSKLIKEITVAARLGGGDATGNPRLRSAIQAAKAENMPKDNIERAIKKGTGELEGTSYEEVNYEAYGPGGVAIMIDCLTDNRNRTISEIRNIFSRCGVSLGESGCVSWIFQPRGVITISAADIDTEELALMAIDAGADDVKIDESSVDIYTQPHELEAVRKALEQKGIAISSADLSQIPSNLIRLDEKAAIQALKLLDRLEEHDDVQHVFTNADFPDEVVEKYHQ